MPAWDAWQDARSQTRGFLDLAFQIRVNRWKEGHPVLSSCSRCTALGSNSLRPKTEDFIHTTPPGSEVSRSLQCGCDHRTGCPWGARSTTLSLGLPFHFDV